MPSCAAQDTQSQLLQPASAASPTRAAAPAPGATAGTWYCYLEDKGGKRCASEAKCLLASQRDSPWGMPGTEADRSAARSAIVPHLDNLIRALLAAKGKGLGTDEESLLLVLQSWRDRLG